jgi:hypothetical protein
MTTSMAEVPGVGLRATANASALRAEGCESTGAKGIGDGSQGAAGDCDLVDHD